MIKSLLLCCVLLTTISTVHADVPKPKTPDKAAKQVLRTGLEIVPDAKIWEAASSILICAIFTVATDEQQMSLRSEAQLNFLRTSAAAAGATDDAALLARRVLQRVQ